MSEFLDFLQTLLGYITNDPSFLITHYKEVLDIPFSYILYGANAFDADGNLIAFTSDVTKMSGILTGIYNVIFPIGALLICISLFARIVELIITDKVDKELILKDVGIAIVVILLLGNGPSLIGKLYNQVSQITNAYFSEIETMASQGEDSFDSMFEMIEDSNREEEESDGIIVGFIKKVTNAIWSIITGLISAVLTMILNMILTMVLTYTAMIRAVKLSLHITFMPIAVGDLYANKNKSKVIEYVKKLIALFLQEYVILFDVAILTILVSPFDFIETIIKFGILLITISTSESSAKQLINAR